VFLVSIHEAIETEPYSDKVRFGHLSKLAIVAVQKVY